MNATKLLDDTTINAVIDVLRSRGAVITFPPEASRLMTVLELRETYAPRLTPGGMAKRLHHRDCPVFYKETSATGRILRLRATPELVAWVSGPASPRRARRQRSEVGGQRSDTESAQWVRTAPRSGGLYWWRKEDGQVELMRVREVAPGNVSIYGDGWGGCGPENFEEFYHGWWSGPVVVPEFYLEVEVSADASGTIIAEGGVGHGADGRRCPEEAFASGNQPITQSTDQPIPQHLS